MRILSSLSFLALVCAVTLCSSIPAFAVTSIKYGWIALDKNKVPILQGTKYSTKSKPIAYISNGANLKKIDPNAAVYLGNTKPGAAIALIIGDRIPDCKDAFITSYMATDPTSIANAKITISPQTYTGRKLEPAAKITLNGKTLKPNIDYSISYSNNVNAGKGTVTIKGKDNFYGSAKSTFEIKRLSLSEASAKIPKQYISGSSAVKPSPKVTLKGATLKKNTDYTISYQKNKVPGTATAIIKGKGNYTGTKKISFTILPKHFSLKNKTVLVIGDSIQRPHHGQFTTYECKKLGAKKVSNISVSGAVLLNAHHGNNIQAQIRQARKAGNLGKYDYYFIAAGTNDCSLSYSRGQKTDRGTSTVSGAINTAVKTINSAHVKATGYQAKIIVITPIGREDCRSSLVKYRKAIAAAASQYTYVKVIDGTKLTSNAEMSNNSNSHDGLHPNSSFAKGTVAKRLATQLDKHVEWLITPKKVKK